MTKLTLDDADAQDLADILSGVTAIGTFSSDAGLDDDADRLAALRRRLVVENPELARLIVSAAEWDATVVSDHEMVDGVRDILEGSDE